MYRVLYRKWRPQTFEEVYGQPHITATLKNELVSGRVAHAYLFTGSRGTGKTTCAKILSKAVNCLSPHRGHIDILESMNVKKAKTFDALYESWRSVFSTSILTEHFYVELFDWYNWVADKITHDMLYYST